MFSLIITIVSIALVVALVAATMNHGGDTLTQGRTSADASAFVNAAQQISSAALMYKAFKGSDPGTDPNTLVTANYLTSVPVVKGTGLALDTTTYSPTRVIKATVTDAATCVQINLNAGFAEGTTAGQAGNLDATAALGKSFGCVTADKTFLFKF